MKYAYLGPHAGPGYLAFLFLLNRVLRSDPIFTEVGVGHLAVQEIADDRPDDDDAGEHGDVLDGRMGDGADDVGGVFEEVIEDDQRPGADHGERAAEDNREAHGHEQPGQTESAGF